MRTTHIAITLLLTAGSATAAAGETVWQIDPSNSSVAFRARHLLISSVPGRFDEFEGELVAADSGFDGARVEARIQVSSIDTGNADRDRHLLGEELFDAARHPEIRFAGRAQRVPEDGPFEIIGELTLKGVTRRVRLQAEFGGRAEMFGRTRAAFQARTTIDRFAYGLRWNGLTEAGTVMVGAKVEIQLDVELVRKASGAGRNDSEGQER